MREDCCPNHRERAVTRLHVHHPNQGALQPKVSGVLRDLWSCSGSASRCLQAAARCAQRVTVAGRAVDRRRHRKPHGAFPRHDHRNIQEHAVRRHAFELHFARSGPCLLMTVLSQWNCSCNTICMYRGAHELGDVAWVVFDEVPRLAHHSAFSLTAHLGALPARFGARRSVGGEHHHDGVNHETRAFCAVVGNASQR